METSVPDNQSNPFQSIHYHSHSRFIMDSKGGATRDVYEQFLQISSKPWAPTAEQILQQILGQEKSMNWRSQNKFLKLAASLQKHKTNTLSVIAWHWSAHDCNTFWRVLNRQHSCVNSIQLICICCYRTAGVFEERYWTRVERNYVRKEISSRRGENCRTE